MRSVRATEAAVCGCLHFSKNGNCEPFEGFLVRAAAHGDFTAHGGETRGCKVFFAVGDFMNGGVKSHKIFKLPCHF